MTQAAHPTIEHIHHRQPLLLGDTTVDAWAEGAPPEAVNTDIEVRTHRVSAKVSNARLDEPSLANPLDDNVAVIQPDLWS